MDLNARRRAALAEVDNAAFGWFHVKACCVAGVGFFTDAYDIFAINLAAGMIGYVYNLGSHKGSLTANQDLGLKASAPVGTLVGQLLFGWLADVVGRKKMYGLELMIIIIATVGQAVAGHGPGVSILGVLIMWRFIMGVGIGGDYPLSAVITSEFAATRIRGRMMTATFWSQGWGQFGAAIVAICCLSAFKSSILNDPANYTHHIDFVWRLLIGLGAVPGTIALYFRLTLPETPRFTMDVERSIKQAASDVDAFLASGHYVQDQTPSQEVVMEAPKATFKDFRRHFGQWKNGKVLLDGLGLNSSIILSAIGYGSVTTGTPQEIRFYSLWNSAIGNLIIICAGLIPGFWAAFLLIDKVGRKPLQLIGFVGLTITLCCMGFGYHKLKDNAVGAFVFLYCLTNFLQSFGPNTTTFVIPGEVFPTRYRSTAHGISAGSGKLGAIIAQIMAFKLKDRGGKNAWVPHLLEVFGLFMLTGIFSTLLLPRRRARPSRSSPARTRTISSLPLPLPAPSVPKPPAFPLSLVLFPPS
ncbi:hypothetical protein JCM6882_005588 [Rhodosporidiobolus microsporus]